MDSQAESAVRNAFNAPHPHNRLTITDEAVRLLGDMTKGHERVNEAINQMKSRGELTAPDESWLDWTLLP